MAKKRKLNYKNMLTLLNCWDNLPSQQLEKLAAVNNISVDELHNELEQRCYCLTSLNITEIRSLHNEMIHMTKEQKHAVERVNGIPLDKVISILTKEVTAYNEQARLDREFRNAWRIREKEIYQQLIDEGSINQHSSYCELDLGAFDKLMIEAKVTLAKEMGLHYTFSSITGRRYES